MLITINDTQDEFLQEMILNFGKYNTDINYIYLKADDIWCLSKQNNKRLYLLFKVVSDLHNDISTISDFAKTLT